MVSQINNLFSGVQVNGQKKYRVSICILLEIFWALPCLEVALFIRTELKRQIKNKQLALKATTSYSSSSYDWPRDCFVRSPYDIGVYQLTSSSVYRGYKDHVGDVSKPYAFHWHRSFARKMPHVLVQMESVKGKHPNTVATEQIRSLRFSGICLSACRARLLRSQLGRHI